MKKVQLRVVGVNAAGVAGYLLVVGAWVLVLAVIVALLFGQSTAVPVQPPQESGAESAFSGAPTAVAYTIAAVMLVVTLVVLAVLPYAIGKWSSWGLRRVLQLLRVSPTVRNLFLAKIIAAIVPLIGFFVVNMLIDATMTFSSLYIAAVAGVMFALLFFGLQLIIARALRIPERLVW